MINDTLDLTNIKYAKRMKFNPYTTAVVNINGKYIAIRDIGLQTYKGHIFSNGDRCIVASIPKAKPLGGFDETVVGSFEYDIAKNQEMNLDLITKDNAINEDVITAMLMYAEKIASYMKVTKINAVTKDSENKRVSSFEKLGFKRSEENNSVAVYEKTDFVDHKFCDSFVDLYNQTKSKNDDSRQSV